MADKTGSDTVAPPAAEAATAAAGPGGTAVNDQVLDAISALETLNIGGAPAASAAMLGLMGADSVALALLNAVSRQQADGTIAAASVAAVCARLAGTRLPDGAAPATPAQFVAAEEADAQGAILLLKGHAERDGAEAEAAQAALQRIAAIAAPGPSPAPAKPGRAAKEGAAS
jgi:hypothetical protein